MPAPLDGGEPAGGLAPAGGGGCCAVTALVTLLSARAAAAGIQRFMIRWLYAFIVCCVMCFGTWRCWHEPALSHTQQTTLVLRKYVLRA